MMSFRSSNAPASPKLRLLRHLARTGGTLISKSLGCMDSIVLLSEAHPLAMDKWTNLYEQANQWHGLTTCQEIAGWKKRNISYTEMLGILNSRAEAKGEALVIREWTHLDFVGTPFVTPTMRPTATLAIEKAFDLRIVDTVRHPLDHWLSISKIETMRGISLEDHLAGCAAYAAETQQRATSAPGHLVVQYEDFCQSPHDRLRDICNTFEITYDDGWESKWASFTSITGDTADSRGNEQRTIAPLVRRTPDEGVHESCLANENYLAACSAWGYTP